MRERGEGNDLTLRVDDVIINKQGVRYRVLGWTTGGRLRMKAVKNRTETRTWWWRAPMMPKGYHLERRGEQIW